MARYREKDETDLIWNKVRRQITRDLDTEIMNRREHALNKLLSRAWIEYSASLESGDLKQLEGKYTTLVLDIISDIVPDKHELDNGSQA
jgi:hypothetical protein